MVLDHPFTPFLPPHAKVLILGTFPPAAVRWSMPFYYPNRINDFWRIMGLIFFGDKDRFLLKPEMVKFDYEALKQWAWDTGIALSDTALQVRRLHNNASDKYLDIVTPRPLMPLLEELPDCHVVASTGEKAASVIAAQTGVDIPKMGQFITTTAADGRELHIARMPSTSRAYPLSLDRKASYYRLLMQLAGIIDE